MPRFLIETINKTNGNAYCSSTIDFEELQESFPEVYQAIIEDASCVGVITTRNRIPHVAVRITDRERWSEESA